MDFYNAEHVLQAHGSDVYDADECQRLIDWAKKSPTGVFTTSIPKTAGKRVA